MVKSTCSSRGPRFGSSTHVTAHNLYTPVPGNLTPSSGLIRKQAHTIDTHLDKTAIHITQEINKWSSGGTGL